MPGDLAGQDSSGKLHEAAGNTFFISLVEDLPIVLEARHRCFGPPLVPGAGQPCLYFSTHGPAGPLKIADP